MNKFKRILLIALSILSVSCFTLASGCSKDPLQVDRTPSGSLDLKFEYMTDAEIPYDAFSDLTEQDIKTGKVTYIFTSPIYEEKGEEKQNVLSSTFPGVFCDVVGEWKVTYVKGSKHDTKTFEVVDSVKPEFDVASRAYDVWFDAVYELDEFGRVKLDDKGRRIFAKDAEGNELLGTRYTLPMIFPDDLSELDDDKIVQSLVLDTDLSSDDNKLEKVKILPGDKYYVPAVGRFTYTLGVADVHGNYNEYVASWNAKDPKWVDTSLEEGYLADYNDAGYINTASSGRASSYWANTQLSEEWLEEFESASGVLKVTAEPNRSSCGAFKFKLFGDSTKADAKGKSLVVKFFTPNNVSTIRVGASTWQSEAEAVKGTARGQVEAVNTVVCGVIPGQWNYAVVPNSQLDYGYYSLGDENLSEYQICFGERVGPFVNEEIVLYIDSVGLAEELPEVSGYSLSGNVLTWNEITSASAYEVTEDGVKTIVQDNEYTVNNINAEIRVRAISYDTRYIAPNYSSRFVNVDTSAFGEYDLAKFNDDKYQLSVEKSFRNGRVAKSLDVDVLSTYQGESDVLKVVTKTNASGLGDFRIKLPKGCDDGITLKFMIKQTGVNYFYWLNPSITGAERSVSDDALILVNQPLGSMAGAWQYVYIPYSESIVKDVLEVLVYDRATTAEDIVTEVYFADIMNGNQINYLKELEFEQTRSELAASLTGDYLADFSTAKYQELVTYSVPPNRAASISAEYLTSYADSEGTTDSGVLKITTTNNSTKRGNVRIYLPKASATGKMTVKFMVAKGSMTMWFIDPGSNADEIKSITGGTSAYTVSTTWNYVTIDQSNYEKNCIEFLFANSAVGDTNILYIGCVMEGDQIDYLKQLDLAETKSELAASLTGNYLADFSSETYEKLAVTDTWKGHHVAESVTAQYLATYKGNTNLLKVTTLNNGGTFGNFTLHLPKAMGSAGYSVRFYLETTSTSALRIIKPHTEGANQGGINDILKEYSISEVNNVWTEVYIPYTDQYKEEITFQIWGNADGVNVFYIDYVADGDSVAQMMAEREQALVSALPSGYLADFSSEIYEGLIVNSKYSTSLVAASLSAQYLETFGTATDVMKITTVNNDNGSKHGGFAINLPKGIPTTSGFTVTFYIESTSSRALRIINPASNSTAVSSSHEWVDATLEGIVGKWVSVYVPYSSNYGDSKTVEFMFFMNKTSGVAGTNVVYIDSIVEGDQTNN